MSKQMIAIQVADSAERSMLAGMIHHPNAIDDVFTVIDSSRFLYSDRHQAIFDAIAAVHGRGVRVEAQTLADELRARGDINARVSYSYIAEILETTGTWANVSTYAKSVRSYFIFRSLAAVGQEISALGTDPIGEADEVLAKAEQLILDIADGAADDDTEVLSHIIQRCASTINARSLGEVSPGLTTGYIDLNGVLGGWQNGELILLAARPSCGKTALVINFIRHAVIAGANVLFVTLEQSKPELGDRFISREAKVNSFAIRTGRINSAQAADIVNSIDVLTEIGGQCFINTTARSVMKIGAAARRVKRRHGLGLVVVDYLGLIEPTNRKVDRHFQVAEISRDLRALAGELKCPLISLAQLNRQSEQRADSRPRLADLRDTGELEQHADTVLMLHRPHRGDDAKDNVIEVGVMKNRNGEVRWETLAYRKECYLFENFAKVPEY